MNIDTPADNTAVLLDTTFVQVAGISADLVGDDLFLISERGGTIHHLDQIGAAIWSQLATPVTGHGILDILSAAFPDITAEKLKADLVDLLEDFLDYEVIREF